jgi:hypothetical protein
MSLELCVDEHPANIRHTAASLLLIHDSDTGHITRPCSLVVFLHM